MKRRNKLLALTGVLAAVCITIGCVLGIEQKKEDIRAEEAVIFSLSAEDINAISWDTGGEGLSLHRDGENWFWDEDEAFPVSSAEMETLLGNFETISSAFVIENVDDPGQYGLDAPETTITITAGEEVYTIALGDYSTMDQQRYIDIGDGKVYLAQEDPADYVSVAISDLIAHDDTPSFPTVETIVLSGSEDYTIVYDAEAAALDEADNYFARRSGTLQVLDADYVTELLNAVTLLELTDYVSYTADEETLAACGLADPALSITVNYLDSEETAQSFTLHIGLDAEDVAEAAEAEEDEEVTIAKYVRVGDSSIIYALDDADYEELTACGYDQLRHRELFWGDFDAVTAMDITLEGEKHSFIADGEGDDRVWYWNETEVEITDIQSALTTLSADSFTDEVGGKQEIAVTLYLDSADFLQTEIALYRHNGTLCVAEVDGEVVSLVSRSTVLQLVQAVQAITLNG